MRRNRLPILIIVGAVLALALLGAALIAPAGADGHDSPADRTIAVDATGGAEAEPDQAALRVSVTAEGDDSAAVRDSLAADAETLRENLADEGLTDADYETTDYRIGSPRRPPRDNGDEHEYRGVHAFEITLDDPQRAGDISDAATDAGAEVDNIEFTLSEQRRMELREQAIDNAMADARSQAEMIAASGGLRVTNAASVEASHQRFSSVRYEDAAADAPRATPAPETTLDTGDVEVTYRVEVTYEATLD